MGASTRPGAAARALLPPGAYAADALNPLCLRYPSVM